MLLLQLMRRAASRADCTAGRSSATSVPMIAITTSNSTSVKARRASPEATRPEIEWTIASLLNYPARMIIAVVGRTATTKPLTPRNSVCLLWQCLPAQVIAAQNIIAANRKAPYLVCEYIVAENEIQPNVLKRK